MNIQIAPASTLARPRTDAPGALILGGAHGSLAIARSLGRRGIPVWFVTNDHPIVKFSRYATRTFEWPGPDAPQAARFLLDLAVTHRLTGWVLFPGGDPEARFVARNERELGAAFRLTTPPWEQVQWGHDKRLTYQRAKVLGIAIPWSYYPKDRHDVASVACRFPVILKPTVHDKRNAFTQAKAWRADNRETLIARYDEAVRLVGAGAIVLQELIPGTGETQFSYAGLWDHGTPVASLVARRTRQYPVEFGYTSTCVETVDLPEVEEAASLFLRSIAYSGLVEVEFKYDVRDRRFKILDANMRAWAWIGLGAIAGVDFPNLAWQVALGARPAFSRAETGRVWMHSARDLLAIAGGIKRGSFNLRAYRKMLTRPRLLAAYAKDDPAPGIVELPLVAKRVIARWWRST